MPIGVLPNRFLLSLLVLTNRVHYTTLWPDSTHMGYGNLYRRTLTHPAAQMPDLL